MQVARLQPARLGLATPTDALLPTTSPPRSVALAEGLEIDSSPKLHRNKQRGTGVYRRIHSGPQRVRATSDEVMARYKRMRMFGVRLETATWMRGPSVGPETSTATSLSRCSSTCPHPKDYLPRFFTSLFFGACSISLFHPIGSPCYSMGDRSLTISNKCQNATQSQIL
jgi:hypothetical protein